MEKEDTKIYNFRSFNLITTLLGLINNNDDDDTNTTIAKFMLAHINDIDNMSIYDVADSCFVSRSSVQRFLKTIGYESYTKVKDRMEETRLHELRYIKYADKESFETYFSVKMQKMIASINQMCELQDIDHIIQKIHDSENVVISAATAALASAYDFQEGMLALGKIIRVAPSGANSYSLIKNLSQKDLLIVISSTGNYALATLDDIKNVSAYKLLVTLNKEETFKQVYDDIFYMNDVQYSSDHILVGIQNIFTKYGAAYLFDLIFSKYVKKYYPTQNSLE